MTLTSRLVGGAAPPSFLLRRPIPEYDGKGMTYEMDHVAPFLRFATSATLTMTTMPDMALAPGPSYDYVAEADAVILQTWPRWTRPASWTRSASSTARCSREI